MALLNRLARMRVSLGFAFAVLVFWLARPTWRSIAVGTAIGIVGALIRLWAAGHLEKSREVTRSGPYRFTRHPLYVGSSVLALGLAVGAASLAAAAIVALYMTATITAAVRTEEAFLRDRFGDAYDAYAARRLPPSDRRFSFERALRNREYRAVAGFALAIAILALKAARG
jgi:protein-S-isoprenylcysteine O-methyltransferase Ste14